MVAQQDPTDPVDEELDRLLAHPEVRERLDAYERVVRAGRPPHTVSHNEARKVVGLPLLPDDDPRV
jgi:hypothetical protein